MDKAHLLPSQMLMVQSSMPQLLNIKTNNDINFKKLNLKKEINKKVTKPVDLCHIHTTKFGTKCANLIKQQWFESS